MSVDAQKLRDEIRRMYESLEDMTLYELLGLAEDASQDTITTTFRQLVKKWHVDRFSQIGLTEHEREMVQAIFSTLNDDHRPVAGKHAGRRAGAARLTAGLPPRSS